jgi:hypothetical protein
MVAPVEPVMWRRASAGPEVRLAVEHDQHRGILIDRLVEVRLTRDSDHCAGSLLILVERRVERKRVDATRRFQTAVCGYRLQLGRDSVLNPAVCAILVAH